MRFGIAHQAPPRCTDVPCECGEEACSGRQLVTRLRTWASPRSRLGRFGVLTDCSSEQRERLPTFRQLRLGSCAPVSTWHLERGTRKALAVLSRAGLISRPSPTMPTVRGAYWSHWQSSLFWKVTRKPLSNGGNRQNAYIVKTSIR